MSRGLDIARARARAELAERLRAREGEIEAVLLARVQAIADPREAPDPAYAHGLREAVLAGVHYGVDALAAAPEEGPEPPPQLLAQARLAARNAVSLDTVLRRYLAGHAVLTEFCVAEAEGVGLGSESSLTPLLASLALAVDRLVEAVSAEHASERQARFRTQRQRQAERVRALLAGEPVDETRLGYELGGHHLAMIAEGDQAGAALRGLASASGRRLLLVCPHEGLAWAWLGGDRPLDPECIVQWLSSHSSGLAVSVGESAEGLEGWRFSHAQAQAAAPIAQRSGKALRYAGVCILAALLADEVATRSLRRIYLEPLESERDGGEALRQTLRAYLSAQRNVSAAAAALGVHRDTVSARLRAVEVKTGHSPMSFGSEFGLALGLG